MSANEPQLKFAHFDDVPVQEIIAQDHGGTIVGARTRFMEWTNERMVAICDYDPGLILERHGHSSDHVIYVLEGDVMCGDHHCPKGTLIVLEHGATFGPMIAGPNGTRLLEHYAGNPMPVPVDKAEYKALLDAKGITRLPNPVFTPPASAPTGSNDGSTDIAS